MDNSSSAPGSSLIPDGTELITATHLGILAVLAVLVVIAIIYGARLKRRRSVAEKELEDYNQEVEAKETAPAERTRDEAAGVASTPPVPPADRVPTPAPTGAVATDDAIPPPATGTGSDGPVTQLKGLGPKLAVTLQELGITTVGQIAALDDDEARALDARLGPFAGRMARDRWIEQARFLAAGDRKGFEAVFGRL